MISNKDKTLVFLAVKRRNRTYEKARLTDENLRAILFAVHRDGATLEELGQIVGVTRQRIHQILKGDR